MLKIEYTAEFKRDYKRSVKRGCDSGKLAKVVSLLCRGDPLPPACRDHVLVNSRHYKNMRECHIEPDWLLIYQVESQRLILRMIRTGKHSDLF